MYKKLVRLSAVLLAMLFVLLASAPTATAAPAPIAGTVTFKATDDKNVAVAAVEFAIQVAGGAQVGTATSGSDGSVVFAGLVAGQYTITVTKVPDAYTLPTGKQAALTVAADGSVTYQKDPTTELKLSPIKKGKTFAILDDAGKPVVGAVFNVTEEFGALIDNYTTTAEGLTLDLPAGKYTITNVRCPDTHAVSTNTVKLTVNTDGSYSADPDITSAFKLKHRQQKMSFIKVDDGGNPVQGATFRLTGRGVNTTAVSNATGVVSFEGLVSVGEYVLVEQTAPDGYEKSTANVTVKVDDAGLAAFSEDPAVAFVNKRAGVDVTFTLRDDGGKPIAGAVFKIEGSGRSYEATSELGTGRVLFSKVAHGTYLLTQTSGGSGFQASDEEILVTIYQDGRISFDKDPAQTFKGKRSRYGFSFTAKDELGQTMRGATYRVAGGDINKSEKSDAKGNVAFTELLPGVYTLSQTGTPAGRTRSLETVQVTVDKEGKVTFSKPIETNIVATVSTYTVSFTKVDEMGETVTGAIFRLTGGKSYQQSSTSDKAGKVSFDSLDAGSYALTEQSAPAGYTKANVRVTVTVSDVGVVTYSQEPDTAFVNKRAQFQLRFGTVDEMGAPVADAAFRLTGEGVSAQSTSNRRGSVFFAKLPHGTYSIVQTAAPEGYTRPLYEAKVIIEPSGAMRYFRVESYMPPDAQEPEIIESMLPTLDGFFINTTGPISFSVEALKDDGTGALSALEQGEFSLIDQMTGALSRSYSSAVGTASFLGVSPGEYLLKQSGSLAQYTIDPSEYRVRIGQGGEIAIHLIRGPALEPPAVQATQASADTQAPVATQAPAVAELLVYEGVLPDGEAMRIPSLTFLSTRELHQLALRAYAHGPEEEPIAGAIFALSAQPGVSADTDPLIVTGLDGRGLSRPLPPGTYYLTAKSIPLGYEVMLEQGGRVVVVPEEGPPEAQEIAGEKIMPASPTDMRGGGLSGLLQFLKENLPGVAAVGAGVLLLAVFVVVLLKR